MGTNTPNLQLWKPATSDNVNVVTDLNNNSDKIDTEVQALKDPPLCIVRMSSASFGMTGGVDLFAQGGWVAADDTTNMFTAGSAGVNSFITIAKAGLYYLRFKINCDPASGSAACYLMLNTAAVANSVVRDSRSAVPPGGEGTWVNANRERRLIVGDKLYWGVWSSVNCTAYQTKLGESSEVEIRLAKLL